MCARFKLERAKVFLRVNKLIKNILYIQKILKLGGQGVQFEPNSAAPAVT